MSFKIITIQPSEDPNLTLQEYAIESGYELLAAHFRDRVSEKIGGSQYRQQYILHPSTKNKHGIWQLSVFSVDGEYLYNSLFTFPSDVLKRNCDGRIFPDKQELVDAEFRKIGIESDNR